MKKEEKELEKLKEDLKIIDQNKEYFYVNVNEHFNTLLKVKFKRISPEFYGVPRYTFDCIDSNKEEVRLTLDNLKDDLYDTIEEAIDNLNKKLYCILNIENANMATKEILNNELNRRFGQSLRNYYLKF